MKIEGGVRIRRVLAGIGLLAAALTTGAGAVQASGIDVLLFDDGAGNLRAGAIDKDDLTVLNTTVVEGELFGNTSLPTADFQADDPGFFSVSDANTGVLGGSNTNLPGGAGVSLNFLVEPTLNISLGYWNGSSFGATPNGEALSLSKDFDFFGDLGGVSGTDEVLNAAIGSTDTEGFIDDHPDYFLGNATPGVYLAFGEANVDGLNAPSNPFWLVLGTLDVCEETASCDAIQEAFNADIEEQIEAGIEYVNTTLVPEPSTALLMSLGLMGLSHSARRARQREAESA